MILRHQADFQFSGSSFQEGGTKWLTHGKVLVFGTADDFGLLDEKRKLSLPVTKLRKDLDDFMASLQELIRSGETRQRNEP